MRSLKIVFAASLTLAFAACSADQNPTDVRSDVRFDSATGDGTDIANPDFDVRDVVTSDSPTPTDIVSGDSSPGDGADEDASILPDIPVAVDVPIDVGCTPGAVTCATADRTRTCLDDGGYAESDCPSGQICTDGLGCVICEPGAARCSTDGITIQTCSTDGMTWTNGTVCDTSAGMVCEGYRCVNACARAASQRSYLGCEYWPTTMANSQLNTAFTFAVTVANPQVYPVNVTITGGALTTPRTFTVAPNTTNTQEIPWVPGLAQMRGGLAPPAAVSALVRNGAYRLVSTAPIAVYQFNPLRYVQSGVNSYTNDASLLLPTHVLTGNYIALAHNTWYTLGGEIVIVGTSSTPTTVSVDLRTSIRAGTGVAAAGPGIATYTLNQGDVVELISAGSSSTSACAANDLSGSAITASQPVAVFVGHDCTNMPCNLTACDHLEEQLFPNETWGQSYVVSGLRERSTSEPSIIRILSQTDGNVLTFTGIARPAACPATLNARQFCEFQTATDFVVTGSGPLLVAQFMLGQSAVAGEGDPAMVLEVPTQQFRTSYIFNVPSSYARNFLTVVYPNGMAPQLDGATIAAGTAVGASYSVSRFAVAAGSHRMTGPAPFGIKVTGTGQYTSYMYPGGLDLNQITGP